MGFGMLTALPVGSLVELSQLLSAEPNEDQCMSVEVTALLQQFASVFDKPTQLPPPWDYYDQVIPLLPGATHVNVRPYHYPPAVKDKIER